MLLYSWSNIILIIVIIIIITNIWYLLSLLDCLIQWSGRGCETECDLKQWEPGERQGDALGPEYVTWHMRSRYVGEATTLITLEPINQTHRRETTCSHSPTCHLPPSAYPGNAFPSSSLSGKSMNTEGHLRRQVRISLSKPLNPPTSNIPPIPLPAKTHMGDWPVFSVSHHHAHPLISSPPLISPACSAPPHKYLIMFFSLLSCCCIAATSFDPISPVSTSTGMRIQRTWIFIK